MKKISHGIASIKSFLNEVKVELQKCAWPTRPELMQSTLVVIVSVIVFAGFVGFSDVVLMKLMGVIIR